MYKPTRFRLTSIALVLCALVAAVANGDDAEEQQVITRDAINLTVPNPFGEVPIFETNDQNGRYIGLHIPLLLDLELHYRGGLLNTRVRTKVLSGLFRLNYDRIALEDGMRHGPIQASVLGFSLYDNKEQPYV